MEGIKKVTEREKQGLLYERFWAAYECFRAEYDISYHSALGALTKFILDFYHSNEEESDA